MRRLLIAVIASFGLYSAPVAAETESTGADTEICKGCQALLELSLAHARRSEDRPRDQYRHPAETLAFFKIRPGMTVVDYTPGGGWYTRVLVPYIGEDGRYIALNPAPIGEERFDNYIGNLGEKFPRKAEAWNLTGAEVEAYNTDELGEEMDGTVDRVLIFRWMHNMHRTGVLHNELSRLHDLLKEEGMLGIVQHRAKDDAPAAYVDGTKGYMREKDVIGLVEAHGFELVASSEVNANPKDSADHEGGVWELPPAMRTKREELREIGESDRMTLLFRKRS